MLSCMATKSWLSKSQEKPIEGFPEPFNYKKEWGIK